MDVCTKGFKTALFVGCKEISQKLNKHLQLAVWKGYLIYNVLTLILLDLKVIRHYD